MEPRSLVACQSPKPTCYRPTHLPKVILLTRERDCELNLTKFPHLFQQLVGPIADGSNDCTSTKWILNVCWRRRNKSCRSWCRPDVARQSQYATAQLPRLLRSRLTMTSRRLLPRAAAETPAATWLLLVLYSGIAVCPIGLYTLNSFTADPLRHTCLTHHF